MTILEARKLVVSEMGLGVLQSMVYGSYVPTVRSAKLAAAIKMLGLNAWNSRTGRNW